MLNWLNSFRKKQPLPAVPTGQCVYAVGDIHGRLDLLDNLLTQIQQDAGNYPGFSRSLVFLGDYVDRGPDSRGVLERLRTLSLPGFEVICLAGNHEEMMSLFLEDADVGADWLRAGGVQTLRSYGIHVHVDSEPTVLRDSLLNVMTRSERDFLRSLGSWYDAGDYMFAHAGIRPGRPYGQQEDADLMWIREPFLSSKRDHGKVVVRGHSINYEPEFFPNSERPRGIGIDTGAFRQGVLTCLALVGTEHRLIQASA